MKKQKTIHIHVKALTGISSGDYQIVGLQNAGTVYTDPNRQPHDPFRKGLHIGDTLNQKQLDEMCLVQNYEVRVSPAH